MLKPDQPVDVSLNDEAQLQATAKVQGAVASGEPVTASNLEHIEGLRPAKVDPDAGWIAFAFLPGGAAIVAFDFRYNKARASALLALAKDYLATAGGALAAQRFGPAVENALAAAELAVIAMTSLQNFTFQKRSSHGARTHWLNDCTRAGNAPRTYRKTLRRLLELRSYARYGEGNAALSANELADLIGDVKQLLDHGAEYAREQSTTT